MTAFNYTAVLEVKCDFTGVPVNTYVVAASVGGDYYRGASEDVLVVYDPSLGFTTGGGWFYWPGTGETEFGYMGDKTNYGFNMKYNFIAIRGYIQVHPCPFIYRKRNILIRPWGVVDIPFGFFLGEAADGDEYQRSKRENSF